MARSDLARRAAELSRRAIGELSGREHCVLLGRAAAGIEALLTVHGWRDQTIALPANTCYIVLWAVLRAGCRPFLLDIDPQTGNLSLESLKALSHQPAALIVAHNYGISAPMAGIMTWARERGVTVIEDCAQAIGWHADQRTIGSWGDAAVFSFGSGKIIDHGLGGALVTVDARLIREIQRVTASYPLWDSALEELQSQWLGLYWTLHQHESRSADLRALYPTLFRMYHKLTVHGVSQQHWIGFPAKLTGLERALDDRRAAAAEYDAALINLPASTLERGQSVLWKYPLVAQDESARDALLAHLWSHGFHEVTRWYPSLRWMLSALDPDAAIPPTPHADELAGRVINLPLTDSASNARLIACIRAWRGA